MNSENTNRAMQAAFDDLLRMSDEDFMSTMHSVSDNGVAALLETAGFPENRVAEAAELSASNEIDVVSRLVPGSDAALISKWFDAFVGFAQSDTSQMAETLYETLGTWSSEYHVSPSRGSFDRLSLTDWLPEIGDMVAQEFSLTYLFRSETMFRFNDDEFEQCLAA